MYIHTCVHGLHTYMHTHTSFKKSLTKPLTCTYLKKHSELFEPRWTRFTSSTPEHIWIFTCSCIPAALGNTTKPDTWHGQAPSGRHSPDFAPDISKERGNTLAWSFPGKLKPAVRSTRSSPAVASPAALPGWCQSVASDICHSVRGVNIRLQEKMSSATKGKTDAALLVSYKIYLLEERVFFPSVK